MANSLQDEIRDLAYHMWKSAGEEYGRAFDFWLMAEEMVLEMSAAAGGLAQKSAEATAVNIQALPFRLRATYAANVRSLAHAMWETAGQRYGSAVEFWVAADRHMYAIMEQSARTLGSAVGAEQVVAKAFETFSPEEHLERIRQLAFKIWETAGRPYGTALDHWVEAEQQLLGAGVRSADVPVPNAEGRRKWAAAAEPKAVIEPVREHAAAAPTADTKKRAPAAETKTRAPAAETKKRAPAAGAAKKQAPARPRQPRSPKKGA